VSRRPSALAEARAAIVPSANGFTQPTGAPPGAQAELIVSSLSGKKVKPVKYLVPGRIPAGKLMLIAGRGGGGKSTFTRSLTAAVSAGRCALGLKYPNPVRGKVLIVAAEDGPEDTILPGLLAEGADISQIGILEGVKKGVTRTDFTLAPEHVELVRERLRASPDIRLIIIDPIASFVGRAKVDDHRATELRQVLDPLSELAERTGATIAMVAHLNKAGAGGGAAVDRIAGSAAYRDAVRCAYLVIADPDDDGRRLLVPIKENLPGFVATSIPFGLVSLASAEADAVLRGEQFGHLKGDDLVAVREQLRRVQFHAAVSVDADDALKAKKSDVTKVQRCQEWLRQFLVRFAFPSKEITDAAKAQNYTFDNLKEAKAQLKTEGVITHSPERFPGGWWSGPGSPDTWLARPEPAPHTPTPPHPPTTPLFSPMGELGSTGDRGGDGDSSPGTEDVL
jgi:hypothetical protein